MGQGRCDGDPPLTSPHDPLVRVGIVSWNTAELLDACLRALPAALDGVPAEVVVVDNASDDDSVAVATRHGVRVIRNETNVGYAAGMNQALDQPRPPVLIALNPDTVPKPGSLATLVRRLQQGPDDVGLVVPRLRNPDETVQHSVYRFPSVPLYVVAWFLPRALQRGWVARRLWLEGRAPHDRDASIDWAIGAVHAIRTDAIAGRRPYDETWFMYVEDLELCWWLARRGWRRQFVTAAEVVHVGNAAGVQAWGGGRYRRYMEASYSWYGRDKGPLRVRLFAATNLLGSIWMAAINAAGAFFRFGFGDVFRNLPSRADLAMHWQVAVHRRTKQKP